MLAEMLVGYLLGSSATQAYFSFKKGYTGFFLVEALVAVLSGCQVLVNWGVLS